MAKVTHWAAKTWQVVACGIDLDSKPNTIHTDNTAEVTCKRCPKTATFRQFAIPSKVETAGTMDPEDIRQAAREDLYNRALSLGYTEEAAYRLSDCFINWDMVPDACPTHPNHSTAIRGGYAVDSCEACDVIKLSTDAGYTLAGWHKAQAERAAEYARIEAEHAAAYAADLAKFDESDPATWSVVPAGYVWRYVADGEEHLFAPDGRDASQAGYDAREAGKVPFTVTKEDILTRPGKPIGSLLNSGAQAPAVTNGDRFIWSEDGSEYEVVGLRNRGAQDELVIFSSGESLFMDKLKAMIMDGRMVPNSGCRSLNHVYCVGPCAERDRNEANASAARTHVETEAECLARIKREDFRVGDAYTFRNMTGYRLHQDRPFSCRGLKCQCGKACHGTVVESPEILTDVAHYVSGGLEIRGDKGSRAVIRPDRLD